MPYKDPEKKRAAHKAYAATHSDELRAYYKAYDEVRRDKKRAYMKVYHATHRGALRTYALKRKYGLTPAAFEAILREQGGSCAACETSEWRGKHGSPVIDHDHKTGAVRGILCNRCNAAAGMLLDNPETVLKLAVYLRRVSKKEKNENTAAQA